MIFSHMNLNRLQKEMKTLMRLPLTTQEAEWQTGRVWSVAALHASRRSTSSHRSGFNMSVYFRSREPDITVGIGEYQEFPEPPSGNAAPETTPKPGTRWRTYETADVRLCLVWSTELSFSPWRPELRHFSAVLLSFGLLCVIQAILNVSLRLLAEPPCQGRQTPDSESDFESSSKRFRPAPKKRKKIQIL